MKLNEREFLAMADAELARIEAALEALQERADTDWDYEIKPGGIIELDFADGSKIIVNRHAAAQEIWVAAKAGGFHFKPPAEPGGHWLDTKSGESLPALLSRCIAAQAGATVKLAW
ncbi:iron donor protein CyaY [Sulfuricystis multivorans]|uniref:iron donor protein CyaY n=1 Tax=Sulfuricystis multivorans TaxID=2211108 RepID=UPI0024E0198D|nr:iron donor protein CyaY [Sulfuricystis multivorans]